MKFIAYSIFLLLSSCYTAQNMTIMEAVHYTRIGGVKGSRAEVFEIKMENNSKLAVQYLQMGKTQISLEKTIKNDILLLTGTYFPEKKDGPQLGETPTVPLNFKEAYLISENIASKEIIRQKINFRTIEKSNLLQGDVPE